MTGWSSLLLVRLAEPIAHEIGLDKTRIPFVIESNRIEGMMRPAMRYELQAHVTFWDLTWITMMNLESFVDAIRGKPLRRRPGANVEIGTYRPPPGGPWIEDELALVLYHANNLRSTPYEVHQMYERLHPFGDGNGRSGRALWAWQMMKIGENPFELPFLHRWYYDSLNADRQTSTEEET